jgi:hypothetical protein
VHTVRVADGRSEVAVGEAAQQLPRAWPSHPFPFKRIAQREAYIWHSM